MRGNVYRLGRRRTGSAVAALALALSMMSGSVSTAWGKAPVARTRSSVVVVAVSHAAGLRLPTPIAHTAGHKIA